MRLDASRLGAHEVDRVQSLELVVDRHGLNVERIEAGVTCLHCDRGNAPSYDHVSRAGVVQRQNISFPS